ncbi:MAG: glycosyltransferase family 2 protein [Candidatus Omnitrophota bacterium]|jgi:glycosyltransferase involved in cell wall biosynthesis
MNNIPEYSVVIPVFNEEKSLPVLQERLVPVCEKIRGEYEIIYVDDGSTDDSLDVLKRLKKENSRLKVVSFDRNTGKSEALYAGFMNARGKWIVTLDADLQNPPEEIPKLIALKNSFDYVIGIRKKRQDGIFRRISAGLARRIRKFVLKDATQDAGCALRMFKREVVFSVPFFRNFHRFHPFLARKHGFTLKEIPVEHSSRLFGRSKYKTFQRAKEGLFDLHRLTTKMTKMGSKLY